MEILLIFLIALLGAVLYLVFWAQFFSGRWYGVKWYDCLPDALIFAVAATFVIYAIRIVQIERARHFLIAGFSLLAFERLLQIPLQEYGEAIAPAGDLFWVYAYLVGFVGLGCVLFGAAHIIRETLSRERNQ